DTDDKDVFRYIQKGDLTITRDGYTHTMGMGPENPENKWVLIKEGTSYSVTTVKGYTVFEAYQPKSDEDKQYKKHIQDALDASRVKDNPIVRSTDIEPEKDSQGVQRTQIFWPLFENGHKMYYVTNVPAGKINPHAHDEDVFRYILKGKLTITYNNNKDRYQFDEGTWFVIPKDVDYGVDTDTGYIAIAAYIRHCSVAR